MFKKLLVPVLAMSVGSIAITAQSPTTTGTQPAPAQMRMIAMGQKTKIKGVVVAKDVDRIVIRDLSGVDTSVVISPTASIKTKGGFFGGGKTTPANAIVRGLSLEVEGIGDNAGNLAATKIRFEGDDLRVAQSIDSRVTPAEERLTVAEQNAQRVSGQIDELMAISNAARGGAKAAQETADAAVQGVNATNKRIGELDDFSVQSSEMVNFKVNSAVLSPEGKSKLDQIAQAASSLKGYYIEVTGFASADGSVARNKELSKRRAQAVLDYLIDAHNIPLRRIGVSYGYGEAQPIADNATLEGRMQNRRVEIKLMVSKGINQNVEIRGTDSGTNN